MSTERKQSSSKMLKNNNNCPSSSTGGDMIESRRELLPLAKKTVREQQQQQRQDRHYKMWSTGQAVPDAAGRLAALLGRAPPAPQPLAAVSRYDGVPAPVYARMVQAVDCAVQQSCYQLHNNAHCVIPLILDVHDIGPTGAGTGCGIDALLEEAPPDTYYVAYYPSERAAALRLLQSLYVLQGAAHTALVLALCHPDGLEREFPSPEAKALVARHSGGVALHQVGRFERTYDIDDLLGRFDRPLYVQQCHVDITEALRGVV